MTASIKVTSEERQEILAEIWQRNAVRREASMPRLDVRTEFHREVTRLVTQRYLALLQPYLLIALNEIRGQPGIAGRLVQRLKGTQIARRRLLDDTGIDLPDHGTAGATGSTWLDTIVGIERSMIAPVFVGRDAPRSSQ